MNFINNKMFRKLHQQNNKRRQTASPSLRSKSASKCDTSYSKIQNKKQNNSDAFDYELCMMKDHLYQGCFVKNKKHGQGIILTDMGVCVIGNWFNGKLHGYALFVTPFGGKIHGNFSMGSLDGWSILQYGDNFQILSYKKDVIQPNRIRYDSTQKLWTQLLYSHNGKLQKVLKVQKTKDFKLPAFIKNPSLTKLYEQVLIQGKTNLKTSKIQKTQINQKFEYLGYVDNYWSPHGLGVIYSTNQLYVGNFKQGALDGDGLILFESGIVYRGEIHGGKIWGNGAIYDVNMDQTKMITIDERGVENVLKTVQGYKLAQVPFQIGKIENKLNQEKGFSKSVDFLCEEIAKHYYRSHSIQFSDSVGIGNLINQSEDSLDEISIVQSVKQKIKPLQIMIQSPKQIKKQTSKPKSKSRQKQSFPNEQILKGFLVTNSPNSPKREKVKGFQLVKYPSFAAPSNEISKAEAESSVVPKQLSPKRKKTQKVALSFRNQSLADSPSTIAKDHPFKSPTSFISSAFTFNFDQIRKSAGNKSTYPYLMQFQVRKKVIVPGSNIGKIVSNSSSISSRAF